MVQTNRRRENILDTFLMNDLAAVVNCESFASGARS
jgi:hypothetical protein